MDDTWHYMKPEPHEIRCAIFRRWVDKHERAERDAESKKRAARRGRSRTI
jgi:hypothetical protein